MMGAMTKQEIRLIGLRDQSTVAVLEKEADLERIANGGFDGTERDVLLCRFACHTALAGSHHDRHLADTSEGVDDPDAETAAPLVILGQGTSQIRYTPEPLSETWRWLLLFGVLCFCVGWRLALSVGRTE